MNVGLGLVTGTDIPVALKTFMRFTDLLFRINDE